MKISNYYILQFQYLIGKYIASGGDDTIIKIWDVNFYFILKIIL